MSGKCLARVDLLLDAHDIDNDPRRNSLKNTITLSIEHFSSTSVSDVGLQVWKGAFLLSDYLISIRSELCDYTIVELGAGCGFCGIVLSLFRINDAFITDYKQDILDLALKNLSRNKHLIHYSPFGVSELSPVIVKQLDWFDMDCEVPSSGDFAYGWSSNDEHTLNQAANRLFIAADCIYDDILTEALFLKLSQLMRRDEVVVLTLEKRYNCTLATQAVVANGYALFLHIVDAESDMDAPVPSYSKFIKKFHGSVVDVSSIPQRVLNYERNADLELWRVVCLS